MASLSERLKSLHDSLTACSTARLLILPAQAEQIANELAVLAADAEKLEAMMKWELKKPAAITSTIPVSGATHGDVLIDLASRRPTNKKG